MWWILLACVTAPDPCSQMCETAADLYGSCLEEWSLDWSAAGFQDEQDYLQVCDTWAWEQRLLADDPSRVDQVCEERDSVFQHGSCSEYTSTDWDILVEEL
ncbi:MAG: hypothetical protein QGG40_09380 [Myxococcota bacterium]|jgi:hypothetical protein|nr:hypothetical protein [Myxococcota bacterium]